MAIYYVAFIAIHEPEPAEQYADKQDESEDVADDLRHFVFLLESRPAYNYPAHDGDKADEINY